MVLLPIKMPIFTSIVRFLVLLVILNLCETFPDVLPRKYFDYRHKNYLLNHIDIFNAEGLVQIEVPGNHYVMIDNRMYLERSYNDLNLQLKTLIPINAATNDSSDSYVGLMETDVYLNLTWNTNDELKFLAELTVLSLETSRLRNISSETFSWLSNSSIQFLNMRYTDIEAVAIDTLEPMQGSLMILDLSHANISLIDINALLHGLHNNTFDGHDSLLIALSLASMGLHRIPYRALTYVRTSLRGLSLYGNDFQTYFTITTEMYTAADSQTNESYIEDETTTNYFRSLLNESDDTSASPWGGFPEMPFLVSLDMRKCNINYVERGSFRNLTNLKKLYLAGNDILILRSFSFEGLINLAHLDISYNGYSKNDRNTGGLILTSNSFAQLYSLEILNLSHTTIRPSFLSQLSHLPQSLIALDLRGSRISTWDDEIFRNSNNLQFLDLSNNIGLASDISSETLKGLRMLQELYMSRTSLQSLTPLKKLQSLRILDVQRNNIASFGDVLENFPLLEHLDISYNYLNAWKDKRAFERNPRLEGVYLHSNMLSLMSEEMLEDFESLLYLTLADNSFVCNCKLKSLMDHLMAINNSQKNLPILIDYRLNGTHVCTDVTLSRTFEFTATDKYCITDSTRYWLSVVQHVIYISMIVILSCVSAGGLIYWKWWYIRYVAVLLKNATVLSMINVDNCEDRVYMYDIFVSYSDQNRNWVIEELIPNIEGPEDRFSICLHERDFQVGVSILENIITGMDQSRTILLIISGCFLKSQWCQFEMHLAQHRLLETCREELVLVLLEEIPRKNRTKILHYLMMVKTYIVWPKNSEDVAEKKLFWKRLRRAITANKSKHPSVV